MKQYKTVFEYMDFKKGPDGALIVPKKTKKKMFYGVVDTSVMKRWLYKKGSKDTICRVIMSRKIIEE